MHRYRILAQISLILSIFNLVLAAPIEAQGIHEARSDEMVVAEDAPKRWRELDSEAASDRSASPQSSPDVIASPQHSSSPVGSTSSGYPAPHLSSDSSVSGYSWLLDRPPRLSPNLPASLHEPASPYPPSSGSSEIAIPEWYYEMAPEIPPSSHFSLAALLEGSPSPPSHLSSSGSSEIAHSEWFQGLAPEIPSTPPWQGMASPHSTGSGSSEIPPSPPPPQLTESDNSPPYSPSDRFTPSHNPSSLSSMDSFPWNRNPWVSDKSMSTPYSSASGGSLSSHYLSALDEQVPPHDSISGSVPSRHSMPEGFAPSSTPDGSPPSPSSPPTEVPPDHAGIFNENMMKKLKIVAGVAIIGSTIATIVGSQINHRDWDTREK